MSHAAQGGSTKAKFILVSGRVAYVEKEGDQSHAGAATNIRPDPL